MPSEEEEKKDKEKPESKEKPGSRKLLTLLILSIVLLGGVSAGAYFLKSAKVLDDWTGVQGQEESTFYEMDCFTVNLADTGGKRFLKTTLKLKVTSENVLKECKSRNFELRDLVLTLLTSKESEEILRAEEKASLKKQILGTLNSTLRKGQVLDVYFTEFLIQ